MPVAMPATVLQPSTEHGPELRARRFRREKDHDPEQGDHPPPRLRAAALDAHPRLQE